MSLHSTQAKEISEFLQVAAVEEYGGRHSIVFGKIKITDLAK
jgi:hypothetical protein